MPQPCRFWQQGTCRNGDNCRFEHAPMNRNTGSANRFAPLQNQDNYRNGGSDSYQRGASPQPPPFQLDKAAIITDLTSERPQWILSAYGPGRYAPAQLFGGPLREQSFEEMRLIHYAGLASGNPQHAVQEAEKITQSAELQIQNVLRDVDGAIEFVIKSQNEHPNRLDIIKDSYDGNAQLNPPTASGTHQRSTQISAAFGAPNQTSQSSEPFGASNQPSQTLKPFGASSAPATSSNPFGTPSQPSNPPGSAFGAPSQPGSFGQPASLGQKPNPFAAAAPAFGAASQSGGGGAFGQPSALGSKPNPFGAAAAPAFGAPSQLGPATAFGQPSGLGQKPNPFGASSNTIPSSSTQAAPFSAFAASSNPFSQASVPTVPSAFGAPSQPPVPNPFGNSSQPSASNTPANQYPFATQTTPSQPAQPNPFAAASSNPFGTPSVVPSNPFGVPLQPLVTKTADVAAAPVSIPLNPFGTPATGSPATSNPFARSLANPQSKSFDQTTPSTQTNGVSKAVAPTTSAPLSAGVPPLESYASKDGSGRLTMFKGKRVVYKDDVPGFTKRDGTWAKIWFPDGPPAGNNDTEAKESEYDEKTIDAYAYLRQHGSFKDGVMPLLPPKRDWCSWDF